MQETIYRRTGCIVGSQQKPMGIYLAQNVLATGTTKNPFFVRPELCLLELAQIDEALRNGTAKRRTASDMIEDEQQRAGLWQSQLYCILAAAGIEYFYTTDSNVTARKYLELRDNGDTLAKPFNVQPFNNHGPSLQEPIVSGYIFSPGITIPETHTPIVAEAVLQMLTEALNESAI